MAVQVEGALATHTEEAVRSAVIGSVTGAAHELIGFIGYGEQMSVILKTHKRMIWARTFKSETPEGILPDGAKKDRKYQSICWKGGTPI